MNGIAALPDVHLMRAALPLGWGLVVAYLGLAGYRYLQQRTGTTPSSAKAFFTGPQRWGGVGVVVLTLACMFLPAGFSPAYWLGLAFQIPSVTTLVLCAAGLWRGLQSPSVDSASPGVNAPWGGAWWMALAGVLLGWALLLDTFGLLPLALYAWGFQALPVGVLAVISVLPWLSGRAGGWPARWALPLALSIFVVFRLPTGNLWDAVLDPWLWLYLHWRLMRPAK